MDKIVISIGILQLQIDFTILNDILYISEKNIIRIW